MRRIATLLLLLGALTLPGCQTASDTLRNIGLGWMAENYDSSRPRSERRDAFQSQMNENDSRR